jgi:hypothetical protein
MSQLLKTLPLAEPGIHQVFLQAKATAAATHLDNREEDRLMEAAAALALRQARLQAMAAAMAVVEPHLLFLDHL